MDLETYLPPDQPTQQTQTQRSQKTQQLHLQKILDLESKIEIESCNDRADYENKVFRTREFDKIQAYLRFIKKSHRTHMKCLYRTK